MMLLFDLYPGGRVDLHKASSSISVHILRAARTPVAREVDDTLATIRHNRNRVGSIRVDHIVTLTNSYTSKSGESAGWRCSKTVVQSHIPGCRCAARCIGVVTIELT